MRPLGFQGYYVEVREGEDAIRAYRKIKRWIKEDKFIDQIRANNTYQKRQTVRPTSGKHATTTTKTPAPKQQETDETRPTPLGNHQK